jgi:hypothetical protein
VTIGGYASRPYALPSIPFTPVNIVSSMVIGGNVA